MLARDIFSAEELFPHRFSNALKSPPTGSLHEMAKATIKQRRLVVAFAIS